MIVPEQSCTGPGQVWEEQCLNHCSRAKFYVRRNISDTEAVRTASMRPVILSEAYWFGRMVEPTYSRSEATTKASPLRYRASCVCLKHYTNTLIWVVLISITAGKVVRSFPNTTTSSEYSTSVTPQYTETCIPWQPSTARQKTQSTEKLDGPRDNGHPCRTFDLSSNAQTVHHEHGRAFLFQRNIATSDWKIWMWRHFWALCFTY